MIKPTWTVLFALLLTACSSGSVTQTSEEQQFAAREQRALQNLMCAFEPHPEGKQSPCAHLIENRVLLSRFFAPATLGGFNEAEKNRGRRITTNFIVNAAANINQCNRVSPENTINIIRDVKIAGGTYAVMGTSPLTEETSSCFITPDKESS